MPVVGPLLAAGIDWLEGLLPLLFVAFWIISQVVNLVRRVAGNGGGGRVPPPLPRRPPVRGEPPANVRVDLERQIEEFLRQARGGEQPATAAERPPKPTPERRQPEQGTSRPQRPVASPLRRAAAPRPSKAAAPPRLADRHLQPLAAAGGDVGEHVRDAFAHDIVNQSLQPSRGAVGPAPHAVAADLAATLHDPALLRRLILMREILDRPVARWE
ncbi:MAG: hypothetical protein ACR2IT_13260 [Pirellulales bacterium]